jgi:hypothetical protein
MQTGFANQEPFRPRWLARAAGANPPGRWLWSAQGENPMTINQITNGCDRRTPLAKFLGVVDRTALAVLFGLVTFVLPMTAFGFLA